MAARKLSSAMSAAKAIGDHLRDWVLGSNGRWVSMGVNSDGNKYNVPEGLIYSFPVTCQSKLILRPLKFLKAVLSKLQSYFKRINKK